MRKLWLALSLLCLGLAPAWAQTFTMPPPAGVVVGGFVVVSSCGSQTLSAGKTAFGTMDTTGKFCDSGSGGGGGGGSVTQGTTPWVDSITQWANVALGAPSNYGTSPGAVAVPGVNAFVTNSPAVTNAGTFAVQNTAATPAGTAIIGKVDIDQTTPGTTNGVQLTGAGQVAVSVAPVTATNTATVVDLRPDSPGIIAGATPGVPNTTQVLTVQGAASMTPVQTSVIGSGPAAVALTTPITSVSQYPTNGVTTVPTPLVAKGTGSTGAVTGTLTPGVTATAYVCGFVVSYVGGTAQVGPLVLSGLLGGSFTFQIPLSTATGGNNFSQTFSPCIPASAVNTPIVMTTVADGTATAVDVNIWGYGL